MSETMAPGSSLGWKNPRSRILCKRLCESCGVESGWLTLDEGMRWGAAHVCG